MSEEDRGDGLMYKEVILLKTRRNTGKSTSIKMLCDCAVSLYEADHLSEDCGNVDIRECIKLKDCNTIIGFASGGDDKTIVEENLQFFEKNKCNICVTACLSNGATWNRIRSWASKRGYGISIHDYVCCEMAQGTKMAWARANREKVKMMLTRIRYVIDSSKRSEE